MIDAVCLIKDGSEYFITLSEHLINSGNIDKKLEIDFHDDNVIEIMYTNEKARIHIEAYYENRKLRFQSACYSSNNKCLTSQHGDMMAKLILNKVNNLEIVCEMLMNDNVNINLTKTILIEAYETIYLLY
jgi:hypothetical protein